jgi:hypothetical protein
MAAVAEKTTDAEAPAPKTTRQAPVPRATLDKLRKKPRQERELPFVINDEEMSFLFRSISAKDYDRLVTDCPPNIEQRAAGSTFNINTFAPALLSRVIVEPAMSTEEWGDLWTSPDWNRGELMSLFAECMEICSTGLRLGPTATV